MFVDVVKISVKAGNGGNGLVSFRRERFVEKGGPDGGDGGDGGDVIIKASHNQNTLSKLRFQKTITAQNGKPGGKSKKSGKSGKDAVIDVPTGTVILNNGELIADLVKDGESAVVAKGGKGGYGNAHFTSSTRQAPRVAELGEPGQEFTLRLELKMIADVGLIGLPNAGKSTFLSVVSNAKPEIADYPFTTLSPNLGVVDFNNNSFLLADIPGLIEGASQGKGLGDDFLRHIERTRIFIHIIDIYGDDLAKSYKTIVDELKAYDKNLAKRPQLVALNKIDGLDKKSIDQKVNKLKKHVPANIKIFPISAKSDEGVSRILKEIAEITTYDYQQETKKDKVEELDVITLKDSGGWQVKKTGNTYKISGEKIERFALRTDFSDYHSMQRFRDILKKTGVAHELLRKGIDSGDKVQIGNKSFTY